MELRDREQRKRTYQRIVRNIMTSLREGKLTPGDKLLSERLLADSLGASRTTVREALSALEALGLIEMLPGGGAKVKSVSMETLVEPLALTLLREAESVRHLFEVRRILEVECARLAAERATESDVYKIGAYAYQMRDDIQMKREADESDVGFHLQIAEAAQNPILTSMMVMLSGLMKETCGPARNRMMADSKMAEVFVAEHVAIFEALKLRDADRVAELMRTHLGTVERYLTDFADDK